MQGENFVRVFYTIAKHPGVLLLIFTFSLQFLIALVDCEIILYYYEMR